MKFLILLKNAWRPRLKRVSGAGWATLAALLICVWPEGAARAATLGWSGSANQQSNLWILAGNWTNNVVPTNTDLVLFGSGGFSNIIGIRMSLGSQKAGQVLLGPGSTLDRTFGNSSGSTFGTLSLHGINGVLLSNAVSGRTMTFTNNVLGGSGNMGLVLATNGDIGVASGATITIHVPITDAGGPYNLRKTGAGLLNLNSYSNLYGGSIAIAEGIVRVGHSNALGNTAGATMVTNGGELLYGTNFPVIVEPLVLSGTGVFGGALRIMTNMAVTNLGGITVAADARLHLESGAHFWHNGTLTGTGSITKDGTGTWYLNQANAYGAGLTVAEGLLRLGHSDGLGTAGTATVNSGAEIQLISNAMILNKAFALSGTGTSGGALRVWTNMTVTCLSNLNLTADATVWVDVGAQLWQQGAVAGVGNLTKTGTGMLAVNGSNAYAGNLTVSAGSLLVGHGSALGIGAGMATIQSGAELVLISNAMSMTKPLSLAGLGSQGGVLRLTNNIVVTNTSPVTLAADATILVPSGADFHQDGPVAGTAVLTKAGPGTLALNATNSLSGNVLVTAGILQVGQSNALGAGAGSTVVSNGAELQLTGNNMVMNEVMTLNGIGITGGALHALTNMVVTNGSSVTLATDTTILVDTNAQLWLTAALGGTGRLTKNGVGTLALGANAAYVTNITVAAGTLLVNHSNALGTVAQGTTVNLGGELLLASNRMTMNEPLTLNGTGPFGGALRVATNVWVTNAGVITLASDAAISVEAGGAYFFNTNFAGAGNFVKSGPGLLVLNTSNTYAGKITITGGTLQPINSNALGTTVGITVVTNSGELYLASNRMVIAENLLLSGFGPSNGALRIGNLSTITNVGLITVTSNSAIRIDGGSTWYTATNCPITNNGGTKHLTISQYSNNTSVINGRLTVTSLTKGNSDNKDSKLALTSSNILSQVTNRMGFLIVRTNGALGSTCAVYLEPSLLDAGTTGTTLQLENGANSVNCSFPSAVWTTLASTNLLGTNYRSSLINASGSNIWNGVIKLAGNGLNMVYANGTALYLRGAITGSCGTFILRGSSSIGYVNGTINIGATPLNKTDSGTWNLFSGNNIMGPVQIADGRLRLNGNQALMASNSVLLGQGTTTGGILDLNGYSQTISALALATNTTGICVVTNSSDTADSVLNFSGGSKTSIFSAPISEWVHRLTVNVNNGHLYLWGTNQLFSPMTVNGGKLMVTRYSSTKRAWNLNPGGTLLAQLIAPGDSIVLSNYVVAAAGNVTNEFGLGLYGNPVTPLVVAAHNLTNQGTVWINVYGANFSVGQFPLIAYSNYVGSGTFVLRQVPRGVAAELIHDTTNKQLLLKINEVVPPPGPLKWSGLINSNWDIAMTANWATNGQPEVYREDWPPGDAVVFDDSVTGSTNVYLAAAVAPMDIRFTNLTTDYFITGPGRITGPAGLIKEGAGQLVLGTSGNDYTNQTMINAGTLVLATNNVLPDGGRGAVVVNSNAMLDLAGYSDTIAGLVGSGVVDNASNTGTNILSVATLNGTNVFAGAIRNSQGLLGLTKTGNGLLVLSGSNSYAGVTTLGGGTLQVGMGDISGSLGSGPVSVITSNTFLRFNRADEYVVNTNISGGFSSRPTVVQAGTGTLVLTGRTDNAYAVGTVSNGTLVLGKTNIAGVRALSGGVAPQSNAVFNGVLRLGAQGDQIGSSNTVFLDANGVFDLSGFNEGFDNLNGYGLTTNRQVATLSALTLGEYNGSATFAGVIAGPGFGGGDIRLIKMGSGTLTLMNSNSFGGGLVISNGTLAIGQDGSLGAPGNSIVMAGGALQTTGTNVTGLSGRPISVVGTSSYNFNIVDPMANFRVTNDLPGSGSLIKNGAGTLDLTGVNTYTGTNSINGGRLVIYADAQLGNSPSAVVTNIWIRNGTLALGASFDIDPNRYIMLQTNAAIEMAEGAASSYSGLLLGASLAKQGKGSLELLGYNTYTNGTYVNDGILSIVALSDTDVSSIGNTGRVVFGSGTLLYNSFNSTETMRPFDASASSNARIELTSGNLVLYGPFSGSSNAPLTKTGLGTLYLSGNSGLDNTNLWLSVAQGYVYLNKTNTLTGHAVSGIAGISNGATVRLMGPPGEFMQIDTNLNCGVLGLQGVLDLGGRSAMFELLSGAGIVINGSATTAYLTNGFYGSSSTYGGAFNEAAGLLALVKAGSGTLTLNGTTNSTFSGGLFLEDGVLRPAYNRNLGRSTVYLNGGVMELAAGFLGSNAVVANASSVNVDVPSGTASWRGNVTINSGGQLRLRSSGADAAGTLEVLGAVAGVADGGVMVDGGVLALAQTATLVAEGGARLLGDAAVSTATLAVRDSAQVTLGSLDLNFGGAYYSAGLVNLEGGILAVNQVLQSSRYGGQESFFNFKGGTLRARTSTPSFMQGLSAAVIMEAAAVIDTAGFDVSIAQPLLAGGTGGLTKNGTGTLTLSGVNTYTGATLVNAGRLLLLPSTRAGGNYTVMHGAAYGLAAAMPGVSLTITNLTLGTAANAATALEFNFLGDTNRPAIQAIGALVVNGTNTLNIRSGGLLPGRYPLVRYGTLGGAGFAGFTLGVLPAGVTAASLAHDSVNHSIDLVVTAASLPVWTGLANSNWDVLATNWVNSASAMPVVYQQTGLPGDAVRFDDGAGALHGTVQLDTNLAPAGVTVSNSAVYYFFTGAGKITGNTWLTKDGNGSLTVGTVNDYSGGTVVRSGTLTALVPGALGSSAVRMQGGILQVSGSQVITNDLVVETAAVAALTNTTGINFWNGKLSGGGTVNLGSPAQAWLQGDNTDFTGAMNLASGEIHLASPEAAGTGAAWDVGNATLVLDTPGTYRLGQLRASNLGLVKGDNNAVQVVELGGNHSNAVFAGALQRGNGAWLSLVKSGQGAWSLTGNANINGSVTVSNGTLYAHGNLTASNVMVASGTLGGTGLITAPVTVQSGGTLNLGTDPGALYIFSSLTLQGQACMKISRTSGALNTDTVLGLTTITYGGTLTVTNTGEALRAGDTFQLFDAGTYTGLFATTNLPALTGNLFWDTSQLAISGRISVQGAPAMAVAPQTRVLLPGESVTLAESVSGSGPMSLQWIMNGSVALVGQTNASFSLTSFACTNEGLYYLVASNGYGVATGSVWNLQVSNQAPVIVQQPQGMLVNAGSNVTLTVQVSNLCDTVVCQWYLNGTNRLTAGTNLLLSLAGAQVANAGAYQAVLTNQAGAVTSAVALLVVNRLPVAMDDGFATRMNQPISLAAIKLLVNDTDLDGDGLTISQVATASTNGATVTLLSGQVQYQPLASFTGEDRFSYTVSDGRGGSALAQVVILVSGSALPGANQIGTPVNTNGMVIVTFAGIPGRTYVFQRSTNLVDWASLSTNVAPVYGIITFTDVTPPPTSATYRTVGP
jgi:autotransporter-associated beta strand protein